MNKSFALRTGEGHSGLLLLSLNPSTESGTRLENKAEFQKLSEHRMEWRIKTKSGAELGSTAHSMIKLVGWGLFEIASKSKSRSVWLIGTESGKRR